METEKSKWPKQISVDKRIVKILSEQTYENFPNAIKEIVTNSYDADATAVNIQLSLKNENITIEDNGKGMNEDEFNLYIRIAGQPSERRERSQSARFIIGQFGVGFLSAFPFFKTFTIETKKKNSNEILYASVPCYKYFLHEKVLDITDIDIQGGTKFSQSRFSESFTRVILSGFTQICTTFFHHPTNLKSRKNSISNFDSITKFKWKLCEDLPLEYEDTRFNFYSSIFSPHLPFKVFLNDEQLLRKVYGKIILDESREIKQIGKIKFRYFICTDKKSVTPYEARYLKIRNLNIGVGERTSFGLGTEVGGARSRLHWLTGEIHLLEGLNELITVSRNGFNFHPDYEKLKDFFIKKLAAMSGVLEAESELTKFVEESRQETRIKNLKLLSSPISKKITEIEKSINTCLL